MSDHRLSAAIVAALQSVGLACGGGAGWPGLNREGCDNFVFTYESFPQHSSATADLVAVTAEGRRQVAIAVDANGRLVVRDDEALYRWIDHPETGVLRDVQIVSMHTCSTEPTCPPLAVVAVGDGGSVLRSEDSGESWVVLDPATVADLRSVTFFDGKRPDATRYRGGVIVGNAAILRSEDGGATWSPVPLPIEQAGSLREVTAARGDLGDTLIAIGDDGLVLQSIDGGLSWTIRTLDTDEDLEDVIVCDEYDFDPGPIYITTAAGKVHWFDEGALQAPITPRAPIADFVCGEIDYVDSYSWRGLWVLYRDGGFGPWPEEAEPSDRISVAPIPISVAEYGQRLMLVGASGSVTVVEPRVALPHDWCSGEPGRPLVVAGAVCSAPMTVRDDWAEHLTPRITDLDLERRCRLAAAWERDAALEHASVASFARWILELLACGAPPGLIVDAQRALADEVRHARLCYGLAAAYSGETRGPGPLPAAVAPVASELPELAAATVREGCINEVIAAVQASVAAELCADPEVRGVLATIAADEARHAALAWRALAWALDIGGEPVRVAVHHAFSEALAIHPHDAAREDHDDTAYGRLPIAHLQETAVATLHALIAPAARRLSVTA